MEEIKDKGSTPNITELVPIRNPSAAHPLYRRDLKIVGQIGETNQKDKLGYTGLERQIKRALKKDMMKGKWWKLSFKPSSQE